MTTMAPGRVRLPNLGIGAQIIALVLVLGLFGAMAIQPTRQLIAQHERISAMARELHRTRRADGRLAERIRRLRNPDFIEQRARAEIGLVRPGEIAYVVMPPGKRAHDARRHGAKRHPTRLLRRRPGVIEGFLNFLGF
jgi:cell division protein FtsB